MDAVFGMYSKLDNDDWMASVTKKENQWLFSAPQIRKRLFDEAEIDERHHMKNIELIKNVRRQSKIDIEPPQQ